MTTAKQEAVFASYYQQLTLVFYSKVNTYKRIRALFEPYLLSTYRPYVYLELYIQYRQNGIEGSKMCSEMRSIAT